jgi:hypothetical protein
VIAKLDEDQLIQVIDLALDMKSPWMRRALLQLPPAGDDQRDRADPVGRVGCFG